MKDRLSIHIDNGQTGEVSGVLEAITVLRNGGTISQSGLVGITNRGHASSGDAILPFMPDTIFNIQSSGQSDVRFATLARGENQPKNKSNLQLLGNGNERASGLQITYNPALDSVTLDSSATIPDFHPPDKSYPDPIVDFSLIRASGKYGVELGFMSVNEIGQIGIGSTYQDSLSENESVSTRFFIIDDPLTISHSGGDNSGTIAIQEQGLKPSPYQGFGKIYVKPTPIGDQTQSLYFMDDIGNEITMSNSPFDTFDGLLYGDEYFNTFGGRFCPKTRSGSVSKTKNTYLGHGAGWYAYDVDGNIAIGYRAASGLKVGDANTIIGTESFTNATNNSNNIVIGARNLTSQAFLDGDEPGISTGPSNTIIIGTGLYLDEYPPDSTLAIGHGSDPLVIGNLTDPSRKFGINSPLGKRTYLTIDSSEHDYKSSFGARTDIRLQNRDNLEIDINDKLASLTPRGTMTIGFSNSSDQYQTMLEVDPSGTNPTSSSFAVSTPHRPHVGISGDLRVLGAIRFGDGTSLEGAVGATFEATTGVKRSLINSVNTFHLHFEDLIEAHSLTTAFDTSESFVAVETKDVTFRKIGKLSINDFAQYVTSGAALMTTNCNALFTQPENSIDLTKNEKSIFIGCDVATGATGWKHSIFIGTNAGYGAKQPLGLTSDSASAFIGYQAGYQANNTENSIFMGASAGKNAVSSKKSIFIGQGAGENTTNDNSIGIGAHALEGNTDVSTTETGSNNIEIIAGKDNVGRLMYEQGNSSNKINIQNVLAGDTLNRYVSIGDARLAPTAPLEVRRDSTGDTGHTGDNVQTWHNEDADLARVTVSGDFVSNIACSGYLGNMPSESWFGNIEGFMDDYIYAPADYNQPTSGTMTVKNSAFGSAESVWIINRDTKLNIHGPGANGGTAYVVATRINEEFRPIYMSCSGS